MCALCRGEMSACAPRYMYTSLLRYSSGVIFPYMRQEGAH